MMVVLTWEHRLMIERIVSQQRASVVEMRQWAKLLDKIGFAEDAERNAAFEAYVSRIGRVTRDGFLPAPNEPKEYDLTGEEVERLLRVLRGFQGYGANDWLLYEGLLDMFGKPEPAARAYPAWFELEVNLQTRLNLLLMLKQATGTPADAVKLYRMAEKFTLTAEEAQAARYQCLTSGRCQWSPQMLMNYPERRSATLTDAELSDLTSRLQTSETWTAADLQWLNPLLDKLEDKPASVTRNGGSNAD